MKKYMFINFEENKIETAKFRYSEQMFDYMTKNKFTHQRGWRSYQDTPKKRKMIKLQAETAGINFTAI